ncbi:MAG: tryptophan 2,3-dioxygenase family protein [Acidobacteriota bacterium]
MQGKDDEAAGRSADEQVPGAAARSQTKALTYSSYLRLDELLDLQSPRSADAAGRGEHDEMLFIVIHQVYELWFKQTLHELDFLIEHLEAHRGAAGSGDEPLDDRIAPVLHTLHRVLTILKTMVAQVDILETMTPRSFASFRARLAAASGFQSPQFRELEFLLGKRDASMLVHHTAEARARLEARAAQPTLYHYVLRFLARSGANVPASVLEPPAVDEPLIEMPEVHAALVDIYRHEDGLTQVCERLVDFDEGLQEWRYRHVKMVERTLGSKPGTGGSSGAAYLRSTLFQPIFPDLWAIRSQL